MEKVHSGADSNAYKAIIASIGETSAAQLDLQARGSKGRLTPAHSAAKSEQSTDTFAQASTRVTTDLCPDVNRMNSPPAPRLASDLQVDTRPRSDPTCGSPVAEAVLSAAVGLSLDKPIEETDESKDAAHIQALESKKKTYPENLLELYKSLSSTDSTRWSLDREVLPSLIEIGAVNISIDLWRDNLDQANEDLGLCERLCQCLGVSGAQKGAFFVPIVKDFIVLIDQASTWLWWSRERRSTFAFLAELTEQSGADEPTKQSWKLEVGRAYLYRREGIERPQKQ